MIRFLLTFFFWITYSHQTYFFFIFKWIRTYYISHLFIYILYFYFYYKTLCTFFMVHVGFCRALFVVNWNFWISEKSSSRPEIHLTKFKADFAVGVFFLTYCHCKWFLERTKIFFDINCVIYFNDTFFLHTETFKRYSGLKGFTISRSWHLHVKLSLIQIGWQITIWSYFIIILCKIFCLFFNTTKVT